MDAEEQDWMTVKETAATLKIPLTRCYELIQAGELPGAVRIGERSIRVNRGRLEQDLLQDHKAGLDSVSLMPIRPVVPVKDEELGRTPRP
jgi:excisionase family DNA binding protein